MRRVRDVGIALLCLPVALLLMAACALLVKLDSKGSVFFTQERVGLGGVRFRIFKLRTMVEGAETMGKGLYTVPDDPRFTRLGLFLRRWSLDELPQVFNILGGSMSLVGPRALPPSIVEAYPAEFRHILRVRPGLTGPSQVSGRSGLSRRQRLDMDMAYVAQRTLFTDWAILLKTVRVVVTGFGQRNYAEEHEVER